MKNMQVPWIAALLVMASASVGASAQRPAVAVASFTNEAGSSASRWWGSQVGDQLGNVLSNELGSTGNFTVVERQQVDAVLAEQDFAASGRVRQGSGAATGNITGARYLITGAVSAYDENTSDKDGGLSFRGFRVGGGKSEAYVAVDLRVIDSETSQVVYSHTVEGRSSSGGLNLAGRLRSGLGGNFSQSKNAPASKAVRAALIEATDYLDCVMVVRSRNCLARYDQREQKRRQSGRDLLDLD